jgi:hypothetical protein
MQRNRNERLDLILVKDVDKLVERMSLKYQVNLDGFADFFVKAYSLK